MEIMPYVVPANRICTTYRYENNEVKDPYRIGVFQTWNGQVRYQGPWGLSKFHGTFNEGDDSTIEAMFDYKGGRPKSITAFKVAHNVWKGYDYLARRIKLTKIGKVVYDGATAEWVELKVDCEKSCTMPPLQSEWS